jgi:hypothetical protein
MCPTGWKSFSRLTSSQLPLESVWPVSRRMNNGKDSDDLFLLLIHDQVRQPTDNQFTCAFDDAFPARLRMLSKKSDLLPDRLHYSACGGWAVLADVCSDVFQVFDSRKRP